MVHKFFNLAVALTTYLFLWLFKLFRVFVLLVVLGLLVLYIYQRRFIYIPENSALEGRQINFNEKLFQKPELWGFSQYEDIYLKSFDGALLHCWHMKYPRENAKTILFFHGNTGNIGHRLDNYHNLYKDGNSVFAVEYRCYGNSEATKGISESNFSKDAQIVYEHLIKSNVDPKDIVLFGRSLGGAVAISLAHYLSKNKKRFGALIVENTFLSIEEMFYDLHSIFQPTYLPLRAFSLILKKSAQFLIRDEWRSDLKIGQIEEPILILFGENDEIVNNRHSKKLHRICNNKGKKANKIIIEYKGCGHNDIYEICESRYFEDIKMFIDQINIL